MKSSILMLVSLLWLPGFIWAQVIDTAAVRKEVDSLIQVSLKITQEANYEDALHLLNIAETQSGAAFGKESRLYARCILYKGWCYSLMGEEDQAEGLYLQGLKIQKKIFGDRDMKCLPVLTSLGKIYRNNLSYDKAEEVYEEALAIRGIHLGKLNPEYAQNLENLANLSYYKGNYEKSEKLNLEAKDIREKVLGRTHPHYLASLNNLGALYQSMEKYEKAEMSYLEAKQIFEDLPRETDPDGYGACLMNLANLYAEMGYFEKADPLFLYAKSITVKIYGEANPEYAKCLANMGSMYATMGNYEKAMVLISEAKSIFEKSLGQQHPLYGWTIDNIGTLYYKTKNYKRAEACFLESKTIIEKVAGTENLEYSNCLKNLALAYSGLNEDNKAEQLLLESINIQVKITGKENLSYIIKINNLSSIYGDMGMHQKSEELFLESLVIYKKIFGIKGVYYMSIINNLAKCYLSMGRIKESLSFYRESIFSEQLRLSKSLGHLSENELNDYVHTFIKYQGEYYSFADKIKYYSHDFISQLYSNLLFQKGFLLESVNSRRNLIYNNASSIQLYELQKFYLRHLAAEYALPIAERDSTRIAEWEEKSNAIEKELVRTVAGYGNLIRQVSWQEVQQKLRPGEAAVELVSYRYYTPEPTDSTLYAALVLLPTDTAPHFIPLFEERQLQAVLNRPDLGEELTVKGLYATQSELLNLLWKPLEPLLRDAKTIYYSPAGLLHRINPAALRDADKRPLSEGRQWVRVGSTRELVTGRLADNSFAHDTVTSPTAAVWGGIRYDMDSTAFAAVNPVDPAAEPLPEFQRKDGKFRYMVEEDTAQLPNGTRGDGDNEWKPLAGSAREAEQVGDLLRRAGFNTEVQSGYSASEERFKSLSQAAPSPRILHVATHGFAYPDPKKEPAKTLSGAEPTSKLQDDPMLRSGLLLAGANYYWKNKHPLQNREDGVLVAYEVRDLNLRNTELAVLSACQTGLGDVVGSEGVYGLQRAFRIAGAKFLIVSLWQVPDEQTQELMRLFYENWVDKRESLRDAFNHAQTTLREREPNPYMWAGFVLIE